MLIIDENLMEIDDLIDALLADLMDFPEIKAYQKAKAEFLADTDLQEKLALLTDNAAYLPYRKELRDLQQEINLNEKVYALKLAENDIQEILSALTKEIASSISDNIYVDENLPLKGGSRHDRHHRKS